MRTYYLYLLLFSFFSSVLYGQNIGVNESGNNPDASAILDVESDNKGVLIPRVGLISVNDPINNPQTSLLVFNTSTTGTYSTPGFYYFDGTDWVPLAGAGGVPAPANEQTIFEEATTTVTATASTSAMALVSLLNFNFTPLNEKVVLTASISGRVTGTFTPANMKWGFRMLVNGVNVGLVYDDFTTDGTRDIITTFQVPASSLPVGTPVSISLQVIGLSTNTGTATFTMNPSLTTSFANIKIEDKPF
ncbi:MAG: hypothetical protein JJT77_04030 [Crocinitomicaceae bacterium]|nr:hypothetical protein [Crocinitomicaceae bacterium]